MCGWPSSAGEIAGDMASIVVGRLGSCGRIMGQFFPCRSNGPASRCPDAPPRSCLMPRGRGFRVLCCLMASESFGCHDISRHWWGASAGWESCCFSLPERGWPGRCGGCRRRLGALHEGWVLLDEGGVHFGWVGPSCSRHNPWSVDPDPRGAGRLKAKPASGHSLPALCAGGGQGTVGRTCDGGAGLCRKDPGLAPARPGVHSADINGPSVSAPSGDRWNSAVLFRCVAPVRL